MQKQNKPRACIHIYIYIVQSEGLTRLFEAVRAHGWRSKKNTIRTVLCLVSTTPAPATDEERGPEPAHADIE